MTHEQLVELIRGEIKHNISPVIGWLRMDAKMGRVDDDKDRLNEYRSRVDKAAEDIAKIVEKIEAEKG